VTDAFYTAASAEERRGGGSDVDRHYVEDGKGDLAWLAPELRGGGNTGPGAAAPNGVRCHAAWGGNRGGERHRQVGLRLSNKISNPFKL
jgi:hypothetical protein